MSIAFRDFVPQDMSRTFSLTRDIESMGSVLSRIHKWIAAQSIDVINVETVLLPAGAASNRDGESDTQFTDNMQVSLGMFELGTERVQVIRVWYRLT